MTRIFKKHEDLYIFANIIELFFVRKIKCFLVFFIYRSARIKYMQMSLYNNKNVWQKDSYMKMEILAAKASCSKSKS